VDRKKTSFFRVWWSLIVLQDAQTLSTISFAAKAATTLQTVRDAKRFVMWNYEDKQELDDAAENGGVGRERK